MDETARNLLGTAISLVGGALLNAGLLTGALDRDKDVRAVQYASGMLPYAVKLGNFYYSIEWVPVLGPSLAAGADFTQAYNRNTELPLLQGAKAALETSVKTSALQGMTRLFGGYDIANSVFDSMLSGTGQFIPSAAKQIASVADEYQRETYDPNVFKQQANYLASGVPGVRQLLPAKVDTDGKPMLQNQGRGLGAKLFENMISPGRVATLQESKLNGELLRIYRENGYKNQFPQASPKSLNYTVGKGENKKTETAPLTTEEYIAYQTLTGKISIDAMTGLVEEPSYRIKTNSGKAKLLQSAVSYANEMAKKQFFDGRGIPYEIDKTVQKGIDAEKQGIPLKNFLVYDDLLSGSDMKNIDKNKLLLKNVETVNVKESLYRYFVSDTESSAKKLKAFHDANLNINQFLEASIKYAEIDDQYSTAKDKATAFYKWGRWQRLQL